MERKYSIYKLTSPSGRYYIGLTKTTVRERWRNHVKYARKKAILNKRHPLYDAITKYGEHNFKVETLMTELTLDQANGIETRLIAEAPPGMVYNVAPGGSNGSIGGLTFWRQLDKDPVARAAFIKKAAEARKKAIVVYTISPREVQLRWAKENPKLAWKNAHRRNRIGRKKDKRPKKEVVELSLKERLLRKHNLNKVKQREVTKIWANRSLETKQEIWANIKETAIKRYSTFTKEEKYKMLDAARVKIDRSIQGPAASKGIKAWWNELRKDPVAYREHIDNRTKTLLRGLKAQGVNIRTKKYEDL